MKYPISPRGVVKTDMPAPAPIRPVRRAAATSSRYNRSGPDYTKTG